MSSFAIKMLAMFAMLIDHTGAAFDGLLPAHVYYMCRAVGRLAMPLFCFMLAEGLFHTRDVRKYMLRLALFAVVSEVPFDRLFMGSWLEFGYQNVGFTLFLGLLGILLFDSFAAQGRKAAALASILAAGLAAIWLRCDYQLYGIYFIFVFYYFRGRGRQKAVALAAGVLLQASTPLLMGGAYWADALILLAAFAAIVPINLYSGERGRDGTAVRVCFYAFYPVHLALLYAATLFIGRTSRFF